MKEFETPRAHKFGSVAALLALVLMALGIGALTYQSRVLHLEGEFWQWFSLVVAFAPTASTFVIAWYKLFAVSDEAHDNMLWIAFGVDMFGIVMQLIGVGLVMINAQDAILLGIRVFSMACSGLALVAVALAAGTSGYRKNAISERQRVIDFQNKFNALFNEALESDDIAAQMLSLAKTMIDQQARELSGKRVMSNEKDPTQTLLQTLLERMNSDPRLQAKQQDAPSVDFTSRQP